jgi:hypothetical protein
VLCSPATMEEASRRITDKLWRRVLPREEAVKVWGGVGSGLKCDGCDVPILLSEPELMSLVDYSDSHVRE